MWRVHLPGSAACFPQVPLFNPHTNPRRDKSGICGLERASHLPKVTQPVSGRASVQIHVCLTLVPGPQPTLAGYIIINMHGVAALCQALGKCFALISSHLILNNTLEAGAIVRLLLLYYM